MFGNRRRSRAGMDIWPGFVDVLATILLVFVFVLMFFGVAQFYLTNVVGDRDRALVELEQRIAELADSLSMERRERRALETRLSDRSRELEATLATRDVLASGLRLSESERARLEAELAASEGRLATAESALAERSEALRATESELAERSAEVDEQRQRTAEATARLEALHDDVQALRDQLAAVSQALAFAEATAATQRLEIEDLGQRLNIAMAERVQELERYRSEFFGRLREVLEDIEEIEIDGDRFRFQSELFFASASAEVGPEGRRALDQLAGILEQVSERIPDDVDWVLQVEGHTDSRPIATERFPSNWELSAARATSIVHYLIDEGIPPQRLAAAGFGEHQPVDPADDPQAWARNRRIELRLTSR